MDDLNSEASTGREEQDHSGVAIASPTLDPQCRICGKPGNREQGPLIAPCCCIGSSRYVHSKCLSRQRLHDGLLSDGFWECSVCGGEYNIKASGRLLRKYSQAILTLLSCVCCLIVIVGAAEAFQVFLFFTGPFLLDTDTNHNKTGNLSIESELDTSSKPPAIEFVWNGVELSYWVGGLLVITFLRKLWLARMDGDYSSFLQYVFFVPSLLSMTQHPETQHLAWTMLPIYSFHNVYFMILTVWSLMRAILSLMSSAQAVDFLGLTAETHQLTTNEQQHEVDYSDSDACICCWDSPAQFKMKGCGHLVACGICRRRLVYRELKSASSPSVPRMRLLSEKHLNDTMIKCPLCRKKDVMIAA